MSDPQKKVLSGTWQATAGSGSATLTASDGAETQVEWSVFNPAGSKSEPLGQAIPLADGRLLYLGCVVVSATAGNAPPTEGPLAYDQSLGDMRVQLGSGDVSIAVAPAFANHDRIELVESPQWVSYDAGSGNLVLDTARARGRTPVVLRAFQGEESLEARFNLTVGPEFGFAIPDFELSRLSDEKLRSWLADIHAAGARYVRTDIRWRNIERSKGVFDWSQADRLIRHIRLAGLEPVGIHFSVPDWANGGRGGTCPPTDMKAAAAFAAAAVKHFQGSLLIEKWEVGNEMNLRGFWNTPGVGPEASKFVAYFIAMRDAIKAANPDAFVIVGGLSAVPETDKNSPPAYIAASEYLAALMKAGTSWDAIGYHPYAYPYPIAQKDVWIGHNHMERMQAQTGDTTAWWVTEFGAPSAGGGRPVTPEQQRDYFTDMIDWMAERSWTGPLFWYTFEDRDTAGGSTEDHFGMRAAGAPKPVWGEVPIYCKAPRPIAEIGDTRAAWFHDVSDREGVFADPAGMQPASVDGPVGRIRDGIGGHDLVLASGDAILRETSGRRWVECSGAQFAVTDAANLFRAQAGGAIIAAVQHTGATWEGQVYGFRSGVGSSRLQLDFANGVPRAAGRRRDNDGFVACPLARSAVADPCVVSAVADWATGRLWGLLNGARSETVTYASGGGETSDTAGAGAHCMNNHVPDRPLVGRFYGGCGFTTLPTARELMICERALWRRTG